MNRDGSSNHSLKSNVGLPDIENRVDFTSPVAAFTRTYRVACELPTYGELAQVKLCALLIFQGRTQPDKIKESSNPTVHGFAAKD